jgi:predicted AlkP superfamily phosphohydrolase/phosphomutase
MLDVTYNYKAYSGYYFAQSTKIHEDYNWDQLTKKAFERLSKKFS